MRSTTTKRRPAGSGTATGRNWSVGPFRSRTERLPVFTDQGLRALSMPVSVVVGERDRMFDSADTARRMRALAPKVRVRVLPGVGHAVLDQTEPVLGFLHA